MQLTMNYKNLMDSPKLLLFSQHGLSDSNQLMASLARNLAPPDSHIIAPNLGRLNTFLALEPLVSQVELAAQQAFNQYPVTHARIIATSLGGVIWVEVLSRNKEWWERIESLILLGAPIGGADMARIIDPFGVGIGIAKDLGQNRRHLAEDIASVIPTLVIAGNTTGGDDGLIAIESTKMKCAHFLCLDGVTHDNLRNDPQVVEAIREFWSQPRFPLPPPKPSLMLQLIEHFRRVPGITDASQRDFRQAQTLFSFSDGTSIRTWTNLFGVKHIFIGNADGRCEYAAFVGWIHSDQLELAINLAIRNFRRF
jgi:hypothetical protein